MSAFTTLIGANELAGIIDRCLVVDCRHNLFKPAAGVAAWTDGHIPGAWHLHMDEDLAGPMTGSNGRHPLPDRDRLRARLAAIGLRDGAQLVAYDERDGVMASRLWWLARWIGHREAAVLDGGMGAWKQAGYPVDAGQPRQPGDEPLLSARPALAEAVDVDTVRARLAAGAGATLIDARSAQRYRGENETIDPVGGHIPGSRNRPFSDNLRPDATFKPAAVLAREWSMLLGSLSPTEIVHTCGSGVSACHNLLAMEHAGLAGSRLYPGSWSEWIADPARPVATGAEP